MLVYFKFWVKRVHIIPMQELHLTLQGQDTLLDVGITFMDQSTQILLNILIQHMKMLGYLRHQRDTGSIVREEVFALVTSCLAFMLFGLEFNLATQKLLLL